MIGIVEDFGWLKILMNVAKFASGLSFGDVDDERVDGTLRRPFDSFARASSFVVRYFNRSQASSLCDVVLGMPMIVPLT